MLNGFSSVHEELRRQGVLLLQRDKPTRRSNARQHALYPSHAVVQFSANLKLATNEWTVSRYTLGRPSLGARWNG
jgi:hypothetical protein